MSVSLFHTFCCGFVVGWSILKQISTISFINTLICTSNQEGPLKIFLKNKTLFLHKRKNSNSLITSNSPWPIWLKIVFFTIGFYGSGPRQGLHVTFG